MMAFILKTIKIIHHVTVLYSVFNILNILNNIESKTYFEDRYAPRILKNISQYRMQHCYDTYVSGAWGVCQCCRR